MQLPRKRTFPSPVPVASTRPILFTVTAALTCWLLVFLRTSTASPFAATPHFDAEVDRTLRWCNLRHPPEACAEALGLPDAHPWTRRLAGSLRNQAGTLERRYGPFESFDAGPSCRRADHAQLTGEVRYYLDEVPITIDLTRTDGIWHLTNLAPATMPVRCD